METIISITEAKPKIYGLASSKETVFLTKNNEIQCAMVPYSEFREMYRIYQEHLDRLAQQDAKSFFEGKVNGHSEEEVDQLLKEFGHDSTSAG